MLTTTLLFEVWMMLMLPLPELAVYTLVDEASVAIKTGFVPTCTVPTTVKLVELTTLTVLEAIFAT